MKYIESFVATVLFILALIVIVFGIAGIVIYTKGIALLLIVLAAIWNAVHEALES